MTFDIDQLVERIEGLYQLPEEQIISNVPDNIRATEWLHVAKEFLSSAEIVEREAPQNWRSTVQNTVMQSSAYSNPAYFHGVLNHHLDIT